MSAEKTVKLFREKMLQEKRYTDLPGVGAGMEIVDDEDVEFIKAQPNLEAVLASGLKDDYGAAVLKGVWEKEVGTKPAPRRSSGPIGAFAEEEWARVDADALASAEMAAMTAPKKKKKKKKVKRRRRRAGVRFTGAGTKALRGGGIKVLQQLLFALGFGGKNEKKFVDGINGPNTLKALRAFQKTHKKPNGEPLQVDGVVGKNTAPALLDAAEGATMTQDELRALTIAQRSAKARAPSTPAPAGEQEAPAGDDPAVEAWEAWLARAPEVRDPEVGRLPVGGVDPDVQKKMQDKAFPPGSAKYKSVPVLGDKRFISDEAAAEYEKDQARVRAQQRVLPKKRGDRGWGMAAETLQRRNKKMVNQEQLRELIKEAIAEADLDLLELYKTQHKVRGKMNEKVKYFWEDDDEPSDLEALEDETSAEIERSVDKGGRAKKKARPRSPTAGDTVDLKKSHDKLASAFRGGSHSLADDDTEFKPYKPKDDIAHAMIEPGETRKKRRRGRGVRFAGRKAKKSVFGIEGLQEILFGLGFGGDNPEKFIDGKNGPSTLRALIAFQKTQKKPNGKPLKADGVVGSNTAKALNRAVDVGADEVVASQDADDLAQLATTLNAEDDAAAEAKALAAQQDAARAKEKATGQDLQRFQRQMGGTRRYASTRKPARDVALEGLRKERLEEGCGVAAKRYRIKRR